MEYKICKLLCLGDRGVGKTCTNLSIINGSFPSEYIPNATFEEWTLLHSDLIDDCKYAIRIVEAPGQDYHEDVRIFGYLFPIPDVILIVFDVANRKSFENVEEKWFPEVKHQAPYVPLMLVGNKIDLRNNATDESNEQDIITIEEGQALAAKLGIPTYLECSALTQEGIPAIIPAAMPIAFQASKATKRLQKLSFQRKIIFSSVSTFARFLWYKMRCRMFRYCTLNKCTFHRIDNTATD